MTNIFKWERINGKEHKRTFNPLSSVHIGKCESNILSKQKYIFFTNRPLVSRIFSYPSYQNATTTLTRSTINIFVKHG